MSREDRTAIPVNDIFLENAATLSGVATRGPYARGIAKREEILQTALDLFAHKGYDRVSVREIARECGLSQAGLLHHFSTKEELFLEVLQRRDNRDGDPVEHHHVHSVDHLIAAVERNANEPGLVQLFVSMSAESTAQDSAARGFFEERYSRLREQIADDVRKHQDRGEFSPHRDADDVAALLIAVADGLQLQWLLEPGRVDMSRLLTDLWETLRRS
jgi:AcrR family transcriptional regulator